MKTALIYPPLCDPTAPYLSVPSLTGYLRMQGIDVLPIDANLEACEFLFTKQHLSETVHRLERRLHRLERQKSLTHTEQLAYSALWGARGDALSAPDSIEDALLTLRDRTGQRFFHPDQYTQSVTAVDSALRVISSAYSPLTMSFTAYRSPFSLLNSEEIKADAHPERNPFYHYYAEVLANRLVREQVKIVGISIVFPSQIQPAFSLAHVIRTLLPNIHITCGGPAITQILSRLEGERSIRAVGPFHSAILFEGEEALLELVRQLDSGQTPTKIIRGAQVTDMSKLPAPDFTGLPLDRYFSPELVLPYDPTRGCYWGVCTFCHYGLAKVGTARYRERPVEKVLEHLHHLSQSYHNRIFYFSQDSVAPKTILKLARAIRDSGHSWRWGTDMRPEKTLTPEKCKELKEGGALSMALGVESGSERVTRLIDKGITVSTVRAVIQNLAETGIGVEAMCFTDFPTETYDDAMSTVRLLEELWHCISLFICGEFDLTHGALIAQAPQEFGIQETWQVEGDELGTGLFYQENIPAKSTADHQRLDQAIDHLSQKWNLSHYPWAGALSTAHTLLWYDHFGADVFKRLPLPRLSVASSRTDIARFHVLQVMENSAQQEVNLWRHLIRDKREISRKAYRELADELPKVFPQPQRWRYSHGKLPQPVGRPKTPGFSGSRKGRRPSHAVNGMSGKA